MQDVPLPGGINNRSRCQGVGEFHFLRIGATATKADVARGDGHDGGRCLRLGDGLRGLVCGCIGEADAHAVARSGAVTLDQHRAVHQQVATVRTVAGDEGVEVACTVRVFASEDFVVAVLGAAGEDDGASRVVAQVTSAITVEHGIDALPCSCIENVSVHADAAQ